MGEYLHQLQIRRTLRRVAPAHAQPQLRCVLDKQLVKWHLATIYLDTYLHGCLLTWILGVVLKQLRLLHGLVRDSTMLVNSLSPQMSELVKDTIAS